MTATATTTGEPAFFGLSGDATAASLSVAELFSLKGRVALVTGSSRGLGLNMAAAFAGAGAMVYLNGRDEARLARAVASLAAAGLSAGTARFDVDDHAATAAALAAIGKREGRLDILVSNAGPRLRRAASEIDATAFAEMLGSHVVSAFALAKSASEWMAAHRYGRIILVSSVAAERARKGDAAYITAKSALNGLTRALAYEYGGCGITCNALAPGRFLTEANLEPCTGAPLRPVRGALGRGGDPWEIAGASVFLASPASSFVTGSIVTVDGGLAAGV